MTDERGLDATAAAPQTVPELLSTWLHELSGALHQRFTGLPDEVLAFQPDAGGNSIGVTLWHFTRWLDVVANRAWAAGEVTDELWHSRGWAAATGYDPTGLGYLGLGVVTGYTFDEVKLVPKLDSARLLEYFDQVSGRLHDLLGTMTTDRLHETAPGLDGTRSRYSWLAVVMQGSFGHVGEIDALLEMRKRQQADQPRATGAKPQLARAETGV